MSGSLTDWGRSTLFGIMRPCQHRLSKRLRTEWVAHLCGLCLALRSDHGQFARIATNYDGLIISVLTEAQVSASADHRRTAGPCPLRGMRTASVAKGEGARLAATVSLVLASAKLRDHVADRDGALARAPLAAVAQRVAGSWNRGGERSGTTLGFDTAVLLDAVGRQQEVEAAAVLGSPVLAVTEPTESATAAAFAYTATLAGRPGNAGPLAEAGRLFGRLAHLLDAVEDQSADLAAGAWNPLTATGTTVQEARRLCEDAVHGIQLALREVEFVDSALAHTLLVHELRHSVRRVFAVGGTHASYPPSPYVTPPPGGWPPPPEPPRRRGLVAGCLVWVGLCCSGQICCSSEYDDPWSGQKREGCCHKCDCFDCCEPCSCCDKCSCSDGCCCCCD